MGEFGAIPFQSELVSLWERVNIERGSIEEGRVQLLDPNERVLVENNFRIDLSANVRMRVQLMLGGFPVSISGRYYLVMHHRTDAEAPWSEVSRTPVHVDLRIVPPAAVPE